MIKFLWAFAPTYINLIQLSIFFLFFFFVLFLQLFFILIFLLYHLEYLKLNSIIVVNHAHFKCIPAYYYTFDLILVLQRRKIWWCLKGKRFPFCKPHSHTRRMNTCNQWTESCSIRFVLIFVKKKICIPLLCQAESKSYTQNRRISQSK